jgi:integrase
LILPTFGPAKLASIQPGQVRAWHAKVADRTSPLQAAKAYRLMRTILNTALQDGLLATNPCYIEGGGAEGSPERPRIDTEAVFEPADAIDPGYRALVLLIASGPGARKGEFQAYRRRHVDLLHARIRTEVQEQDAGGRLVASAPKNDSSRWTTLPAFLVQELEQHLERFAQPGPEATCSPARRAVRSRPSNGTRASASPGRRWECPTSTPTTSATPPGRYSPSRAPRPARSWPASATAPAPPPTATSTPPHRRDAELAARLDTATAAARSRRSRDAG